MAHRPPKLFAARWTAVALVGVLAVGVAIVSALALAQSRGPATAESNPIPSFSLGVQTATPTPSPEPSSERAEPLPSEERFLAAGSGAWWRGTAGRCGEAEPLVERSVDGGQTWIDVTPRYLGMSELMSLGAFTSTEAEMVVKVGPSCEVQALRTFTQGQFWEPYPDVLAASRYVDSANSGVVDLGDDSIAAPCEEASGLRTAGETIALLCDDSAWQLASSTWIEIPSAERATALWVEGETVWIAGAGSACDGLSVSQVDTATQEETVLAACVASALDSPAAITVVDDRPVLWVGDDVSVVG
ncbi:hypothetical protein [Microbacterium invictum]|uniref:Uncharacterized protein n=1 Tax=Microbacterium invictum TaxID=515415 RepID=A0ABZ0V8J5_9MICO|nr:hypothetical protein [Microbacterium invictum]WQB69794.1 hypothetical protein T9R20_13990 [Microbacterium invictum]